MSHHHTHGGSSTRRYMGLSVALTLVFVAGEAAAGWFANSLALLSDAGHNFADALALALSWYALRVAGRPADARRTFGSHRVGILAVLVNAVSLVVIALVIFWEAVHRLRTPEPAQGGLMIGVALVAVVLNGFISFRLKGEAKHDLNVRSAYLHMLGDTVSAVGVVVAGVIVALTGSALADPPGLAADWYPDPVEFVERPGVWSGRDFLSLLIVAVVGVDRFMASGAA